MAILPLDQVRAGLLTDPAIYPQNLDLGREAVLFLRMSPAAYQAASFLDDRILTPQSDGRWLFFSELEPLMAQAQPAPAPLHFIFHSGHVGSTLISRLIENAGGTLSLREPLALRVLAAANDDRGESYALLSPARLDQLIQWHLAFWRRGFADTRAVVLKATSSAGRLARTLLNASPDSRALYLNLAAEPYLATLLAGENSYLDLRGMGPERIKRLAALGAPSPTPLHAMSLGELAALTWAAETLTQAQTLSSAGARVLPLDFDAFLRDPVESTRRIFTHFGLEAPEGFFAQIPQSDVFTRYSKAPEHAYTPHLRAEILNQSRARNAEEIRKGLAWLERAAAQAPALARLISA